MFFMLFGDPGINPLQHSFASTVPGKSEGVKPCDVFTAEKVDAAHENGLTQGSVGSDTGYLRALE